MALATSIGSLSRPTRGILCERHIAKVKRGLQEGNNLVGSVNCLTRAGGALDGLVFYGEASDHEVARGDLGERRKGEVVRRIPLPRTQVNRDKREEGPGR